MIEFQDSALRDDLIEKLKIAVSGSTPREALIGTLSVFASIAQGCGLSERVCCDMLRAAFAPDREPS